MARDLPPAIRDLAEHQRGILTSHQLARAGISKEQTRTRIRRGRWQRIHRGVYAVFSGEPGRESVLWAAVLFAGPGAVLSYRTAAEADKLVDEVSELVHVTIPVNRRIGRTTGIVVHRSGRVSEATHPVLSPPRTRIEETILDLAEAARTGDEAIGWVLRGLGRRLTRADLLRAAMQLRAKMRWRKELSAVLSDDMQGVHSLLEHRYVRDVERPHGLPRGIRQARFRENGRNRYRDVLIEAYHLAIELDGNLAHPAETRWRDIRRDNAAVVGGIATLRYGWTDVTSGPCLVAAEIATVLKARGYTGCRPCSPSCPVGRIGSGTQEPAHKRSQQA
jgi:Transcriptional regulator, AbiEi antitoxin